MADLLDTLPKRIKVGSFTFAVERVASSHPDLQQDLGACWGLTQFQRPRILLDDSMPLDRLVNTVWHEVNHAINHSYGIQDGCDEESIACQSANGWMQVNLDNPKLEQWLHRAWRELRKAR
jgi:hypothetical protein